MTNTFFFLLFDPDAIKNSFSDICTNSIITRSVQRVDSNDRTRRTVLRLVFYVLFKVPREHAK